MVWVFWVTINDWIHDNNPYTVSVETKVKIQAGNYIGLSKRINKKTRSHKSNPIQINKYQDNERIKIEIIPSTIKNKFPI